ncbi:hypothetical protein RJ640_011243 [Escallonia rubra]|uniref:Activator of Hsp90 ATPase AHSA1-like N-terminal domain-containing protein n=1 Tax=Escallonia rubra TaxID=112253 RepID=A0AA88RS31_9ASTE|nr:hypothetical protein RJ640_011243 [Escallonia rubra]
MFTAATTSSPRPPPQPSSPLPAFEVHTWTIDGDPTAGGVCTFQLPAQWTPTDSDHRCIVHGNRSRLLPPARTPWCFGHKEPHPGLGRRGQDAAGNSLLKAEKLVEIPYIADENADEDPDVTVTLKNDGSIGKRLKEAFLAKGKAFVLEQVRVFVVAMAKGGPAKEELRARCSRRRRQRKPQP